MQTQPRSKQTPGIRARHSRSCGSRKGAKCTCQASYEAFIFDRSAAVLDKDGKQKLDKDGRPIFGQKVRKTFTGQGAKSAAKQWRTDALAALGRGAFVAPTRVTLKDAAAEWLKGASATPPTILTRSGTRFKPSALRSYRRDLAYVLPKLGHHRLSDLRRADVQALVDELLGRGLSPSRCRNILMPLRAICRHALERDELVVNPTQHLRMPSGIGRRERAASPSEAAELLEALPVEQQALWAVAMYAGLRLGELRGLRWSDIDLERNELRITRAWDDVEGPVLPKSAKGVRVIPIPAVLRTYLIEHRLRADAVGDDDLVFGAGDKAFRPDRVRALARTAWEATNVKRREQKLPELVPIGLHECRHSYVSLLHAAGRSLEEIGDIVGHSSTYMTDRYRHLIEGEGPAAAAALDAYLTRATTTARERPRLA